MKRHQLLTGLLMVTLGSFPQAQAEGPPAPVVAQRGMVVSQDRIASKVGAEVLAQGGNAVDAAIATAFALAVVHPAAGNLGGGGFLLFQPHRAEAAAYDFREVAPAAATWDMFQTDGKYDATKHHHSHLAVGVPGTVAGLHLAWQEHGTLPWEELLAPAIRLADEGFVVSEALARSLENALPRLAQYPASRAQFTQDGRPYRPGETLRQAELAKTLRLIQEKGPAGFYQGETAELLEKEMIAHGGILRQEDLKNYRTQKRTPVTGTYRGHTIVSFPPPSSGGVALIQMLNILEGYPLAETGPGSPQTLHWMAEAMRRAYADRAQHLGDPDHNPNLPIERLISKEYADQLRRTIRDDQVAKSRIEGFTWGYESDETTHLSVVDSQRNAVALTYTLEYSYGSGIIAPGTGFLLNNEMGDFNPVPGLTTPEGLIGSPPNQVAPGKRMLSSMTPTIVLKGDDITIVTGSPGGRTIINTVLQTIVNVIDHGMTAQQAVAAPRIHHQWQPDRLFHERGRFPQETLATLRQMGHHLDTRATQGAAQMIVVDIETGHLQGAPTPERPTARPWGSELW